MSHEWSIEGGKCIRCGACVIFAPEVFAIGAKGPARVVRPPATPAEERRARGALLNCPTNAVVVAPRVTRHAGSVD
jgi:ferredoxin